MNTLLLTERVASECRLRPVDVDFLLAEHRAHVDLVPAGRRGWYRLTPTGHVGTIVGPGCRLVIRPKMPLRNFFHLLDPIAPLPTTVDHVSAVPGAEALDFLAGRLAQLLAERTAAGLHRAYTERAEQGPFLQGRLDLPAQLRQGHGRKDRLACRYEDFSADVPCNQVPKATVELLLRSPLLGAEVRAALRRQLSAFAAVSSIALEPDSFTAAADRLTEAYRPLLDLCRLLFESLAPGPSAGSVSGPAFLLNMERVYERYVTEGLRRVFEGSEYAVAVQPLQWVSEPAASQPDLAMRPDVVILDGGPPSPLSSLREERDGGKGGGQPVLVVDVKWKVLAGSPVVIDDVYQVLAYGAGLGVRRAVLVYPGRRDRLWAYRLRRSPILVEVRTLRVVGSRQACRLSLQRLGHALRPPVRHEE